MKNRLLAEVVAEAFGTFVIITFGCGVVAMVVLFGHGTQNEIVNGGFTNITIAWGLGVTMGVYMTAKISGGHLNPAVTLAMAVFRGFPWWRVLPYMAAQVFGAFLGAALVYLNYRPAFLKYDPSLSQSAGVFATFPAFPDLPMAGFLDQVIGTFLLLLLIFTLTDEDNATPPGWLVPILVGFSVIAIGMSFGGMHGYAINPARDFGPRLFTLVAGFSNNGFSDGTFLVPLIAPLIGGLAGAGAYDLLIRRWLREE
ncbi:MAG: MIP/aquaporin family protein [Bryobacteraceae bacterium]|nr:MIP/aquaporin family protein [Bryobacteraceae bacterium]